MAIERQISSHGAACLVDGSSMHVPFVKALLRIELDTEIIAFPDGARLDPEAPGYLDIADVSAVNDAIARHASERGLLDIDDAFTTFWEAEGPGALVEMNCWHEVLYEMPDRWPIGWVAFVAEGLPTNVGE